MNNEKIEAAEKLLLKVQNRLREIEDARSRVVAAKETAEATIPELTAKLPSLLAARVMGDEAIAAEIDQIKLEIARNEEKISDALPTFEGLDKLRHAALAEARKAGRLIKREQKKIEEMNELRELGKTTIGLSPSQRIRLEELSAELDPDDNGHEPAQAGLVLSS